MPMEHKAFRFDYQRFSDELESTLANAVTNNDPEPLEWFIEKNRSDLCDPNEGEKIPADWQSHTERDPQAYGDIALTQYYDPLDTIGLGYDWTEIFDILDKELPGGKRLILGRACGTPGRYFDPGRYGSYFQSPLQVKNNLTVLNKLIADKPVLAEKLRPVAEMLQKAAESDSGLYVTF